MHTQQIEGAQMNAERADQTPVSEPQDAHGLNAASSNSSSAASKGDDTPAQIGCRTVWSRLQFTMQIREIYMFRFRVSLLFCHLIVHRTDSSVPPESLSVPMEEDGASGHVTPAEDKSPP
ncbi:hypothetical protein M9458_020822, partial [Cirrhinus mrigala]